MIFISLTERVVMIDAISPMLVSTITSLRTLSDTTLFTVPGSWLRMLSSISCEDSPNEIGCQRQPAVDDTRLQRYRSQAAYDRKFPGDARWRAGGQVVMIVV